VPSDADSYLGGDEGDLGSDEEDLRIGRQNHTVSARKRHSKSRVRDSSPRSVKDFENGLKSLSVNFKGYYPPRQDAVWGSASEREEERFQKGQRHFVVCIGERHSRSRVRDFSPSSVEAFKNGLRRLSINFKRRYPPGPGAVWGSASERERGARASRLSLVGRLPKR
jgi:hypothetical protein